MEHCEIERKWLMDGFPPLAEESEELLEQGYLSFFPTVRIRRRQTGERADYWLTIKGSGTLCRTEVELPLSAGQYEALLGLLAAPLAHKRLRRYRLPGGQELECSLVDEGEADAFCYAEVEFESPKAARAFLPPDFLGREVTEEPGYTVAAHCQRKAQDAEGAPGGE